MKVRTILAAFALFAVGVSAQAQTTNNTSASQQASSASNSFGTLTFSQSPADQHLSETIRNVSAPVLGAFAPNMSPLGCTSTAQGGAAIAGVSLVAGAPVHDSKCELEVSAGEMGRQSYNIRQYDPASADLLQKASMQIRCRINQETYEALVDSGFECKRKPKEMESRTDSQPENYKVH